jgi:hypothetical protein
VVDLQDRIPTQNLASVERRRSSDFYLLHFSGTKPMRSVVDSTLHQGGRSL